MGASVLLRRHNNTSCEEALITTSRHVTFAWYGTALSIHIVQSAHGRPQRATQEHVSFHLTCTHPASPMSAKLQELTTPSADPSKCHKAEASLRVIALALGCDHHIHPAGVVRHGRPCPPQLLFQLEDPNSQLGLRLLALARLPPELLHSVLPRLDHRIAHRQLLVGELLQLLELILQANHSAEVRIRNRDVLVIGPTAFFLARIN